MSESPSTASTPTLPALTVSAAVASAPATGRPTTPSNSDASDSAPASRHGSFCEPRAQFSPVASLDDNEEWVTLSVEGQQFRVALSQLQKHSDTMLGRMFTSARRAGLTRPRPNGAFTLDNTNIRPVVFQAALEFYERGTIICPPDVDVAELIEACEYLLIPVSLQTIQCRNLAKLMHFLANRGAVAQFVDKFLPKAILPVLDAAVQQGDRQACLVFLHTEEVLTWDEQDPPPFDDDAKKVIFDSHLCRFLSFAENRELVKEILQERGFKRVRLGIEGFPIDMLCVDPHRTTLPENPYRYEQRPYIFVSWEKEEKGNQHVNFQYVRKTSTGGSSAGRKTGNGRWM